MYAHLSLQWQCTSFTPMTTPQQSAPSKHVTGLISNNDETTFRSQADRLTSYSMVCHSAKTVEMLVELCKAQLVSKIESFRFFRTGITNSLKWANNITTVLKNVQQRPFFLQLLRNLSVAQPVLKRFYSAIVESVISCDLTKMKDRYSIRENCCWPQTSTQPPVCHVAITEALRVHHLPNHTPPARFPSRRYPVTQPPQSRSAPTSDFLQVTHTHNMLDTFTLSFASCPVSVSIVYYLMSCPLYN